MKVIRCFLFYVVQSYFEIDKWNTDLTNCISISLRFSCLLNHLQYFKVGAFPSYRYN